MLLKNDRWPGRNNPAPILPLQRQQLESIAVIGSHANRLFFGAYSGEPAAPPLTTYQGVTNHVGDTVIVRSVPWTEIDDPKKKNAPVEEQKRNLEAAIKAASSAGANTPSLRAVCVWKSTRIVPACSIAPL